MSNLVRRLILAAVLMAGLFPAVAQQFPTIPSGTFIGRTQIGSGPSQSIPFSALGPIGGFIRGPFNCGASTWFFSLSPNGAVGCTQPSFSDLLSNIAISQMNGGTGASASTMWRGDGAWATPQTMPFTAANTSPASQTMQNQLQKVPVTCEDFAVCGTSDDTTAITAAMAYAAVNNRCFSFNNHFYNVSSVLVSGQSLGLCLTGRGGLTGKSTGTYNAVLEIKDTIQVTMDGNISINCNNNGSYGAGFKLWSDGSSSSQFNKIKFSAIQNCKLAKQYGDPSAPTVPLSEILDEGGYLYNTAQGVVAYGSNTIIHFANNNNIVDNTNWPGTGAINWTAIGATLNIIGGESVNAISTTGIVALVEPISTTGNPYGSINISSSEIEWAGALMNSANPSSLASPTVGSFSVQDSFGFTSNVTISAMATDSTYVGQISARNNRFFAGSARTGGNISLNNSSATVYFDLQSFGTNFLQGYSGVGGGIQYLTTKDFANGVTVSGTASQNPSDSIVTFNCASACTYTLLPPTRYPGRMLFLNTAGSGAVSSASSNILSSSNSATTSILAGTPGKFVVLMSDTSLGSYWRVVSFN